MVVHTSNALPAAGRWAAAFVGGVAVMGAEMAFARQAAPWFGSSLPVWAILISVLLSALALGSAWGARLSLRRSVGRRPAQILTFAGAGLLAAAWLMPPLLAAAGRAREVGVGAAVAAGGAALVTAGLPVFLLGALPPALVAAWVAQDAPAGLAAGRLGALATAGSLVGTLGTTFLLLPWLGTRATVIALAALCLAAGLLHASTSAKRAASADAVAGHQPAGSGRWGAVVLLLAAVGSGLVPRVGPRVPAGLRLREARESAYHAAFVLDAPDGTRTLRLNSLKEAHSHFDPRGPTMVGVWPYFLLAQALRPACVSAPRRVLILGMGAGTLARDLSFAFPRSAVVGVEIDPVVVELGRRWFGLPAATEVHVEDARRFVNRAPAPAAGGGYDLIVVDAFSGPYLPFHLATRESFERLRTLIDPGGVLAVNVLSVGGDDGLQRAVGATLASVFAQVRSIDNRPGYNTVLFASSADEPRTDSAPAATCAQPLHPAQRAFVPAALQRVRPLSPSPGPVLTDDHAPVEWLTHRMAWAALFPAGQRGRP